MVSSLVVETRHLPATARGWPLALLILICALLVGFSTAIAAEKKGFVILPNKAPHFGPIGDETTTADILASHEQTGGSFGVWRYTSDNRSGPPLHIHRTEDEFFYVVKGTFDFQLDDCITRTPAGSFVFIPKDTIHTFRHVGPEPGVLLGTVHPAGFEGLFRDLPGADVEGAKALFAN
jgi:quercetin dioxygenase-like cupin family protein